MHVSNDTNKASEYQSSIFLLVLKSVVTYLSLFALDVSKRTLGRDSIFIPEDQDVLVVSEETVNIFESAVRGFGVEEVDDWDERGVEDGPNDVEFPVEGLNADGGDFNDY